MDTGMGSHPDVDAHYRPRQWSLATAGAGGEGEGMHDPRPAAFGATQRPRLRADALGRTAAATVFRDPSFRVREMAGSLVSGAAADLPLWAKVPGCWPGGSGYDRSKATACDMLGRSPGAGCSGPEAHEGVMMIQQDPSGNSKNRARLSSGAIISLVGGGLLLIFIIQNTEDIKLHFLVWHFSWPLWLYTIITAVFGALVWIGLGVMRRHRRRQERRAARRAGY